ncbi:uncharacterized protein RJT21DRAFT_19271 [Scheffersomyces amazonensis]|uniref:uncharacterized protein n=1 Tax=Scheffersomyces amazonensis TaxID=1078765 RepID=UPI00315DCCCF
MSFRYSLFMILVPMVYYIYYIYYIAGSLSYSQEENALNNCQMSHQDILLYNGFVNPIAMEAIEWKYYIIYCCMTIFELGWFTYFKFHQKKLLSISVVNYLFWLSHFINTNSNKLVHKFIVFYI